MSCLLDEREILARTPTFFFIDILADGTMSRKNHDGFDTNRWPSFCRQNLIVGIETYLQLLLSGGTGGSCACSVAMDTAVVENCQCAC